MVHKSPPRRIRPKTQPGVPAVARRGRPRAYDPEAALRRAADCFWDAGFAGTSLDDLSAATGMNRPSLYAAFGDKRALFAQALALYRARIQNTLQTALESEVALSPALRNAYRAALDIFCAGDKGQHGCFIIGSALAEAVVDIDLRGALAAELSEWDGAFEARLHFAKDRGELGAKADPAGLAKIAAALLHSLAVRARAGDARHSLEAMVESAVALICGAGKDARPPALFGTY